MKHSRLTFIATYLLIHLSFLPCFANSDFNDQLGELLARTQNYTEDTGPHDFDAEISGWSQNLYDLVAQIDPTLATRNPDSTKQQILKAATNTEETWHGISAHDYLVRRYGALYEFVETNNQLQQVIGWALDARVCSLDGLVGSLCPINDSPSAMYSVFFITGVLAVEQFTKNNPDFFFK